MPNNNTSAEEQVKHLRAQLAELQQWHESVCRQRDHLAERNADLEAEVDELKASKAAMIKVFHKLRAAIERL